MNKKILLGCTAAVLLLALLQVPIQQRRVLSYGVDTYSAHRPLSGKRMIQQYISTQHTVTGIGSILVDLRRSNQLTPVAVEVTDNSSGELLVSAEISASAIRDDQFAYTRFPDMPIAKNRDIRILFTAQSATGANPIGLRIDPKNNDISLALIERMPVWRAVVTMVQNKGDAWGVVFLALIASLLLALPVFVPHQKKWWLTGLGIIVLGTFWIRAATVPHFGGVSGGDAYNYLSISQTLSAWKNPFENTKRLPGYPLLLTPFYASGSFDDQDVMRYTQIIASISGVFLIAGIARTLNLSWPTAITASAILAFQKDYYWTSLRPEPYSLYTALLLACLLFFFKAYSQHKTWIYVVFGLCLGYGAMVRQE
ncbi:MAG: glycosyltransferase family 39 protein, partial [bacterium]|nr:glycosyltransferase family 39 protein [bacterium]